MHSANRRLETLIFMNVDYSTPLVTYKMLSEPIAAVCSPGTGEAAPCTLLRLFHQPAMCEVTRLVFRQLRINQTPHEYATMKLR